MDVPGNPAGTEDHAVRFPLLPLLFHFFLDQKLGKPLQGRLILPGFQEPRVNRRTEPAIVTDPSPACGWKLILETSAVLISWRIH